MASTADENILARLIRPDAGQKQEAWAAVAATRPAHEPETDGHNEDDKLNSLLARIKNLTSSGPDGESDQASDPSPTAHAKEWTPLEPASFRDAGLTESEVEALILKFLLTRGKLPAGTLPSKSNCRSY